MPQDPNLYGQRPTKKSKHLAVSGSLDFAAQLTSYISTSAATTDAGGLRLGGRVRKRKPDESAANATNAAAEGRQSSTSGNDNNKKKQKQAPQGQKKPPGKKATGVDAAKLVLKNAGRNEDDDDALARSRRKLEEKAKLYAAMKRGDVDRDSEPGGRGEAGGGVLVDFDRKWAESHPASGSDREDSDQDSDSDAYDNDNGSGGMVGLRKEGDQIDMVEFEDEFGRLRRVTPAEKERMDRQLRRGVLGTEELGRMSARPAMPSGLIYGDAIQSLPLDPGDRRKMDELARNRDRSPTPPEQAHYNADAEVRSKGVGFYKFSRQEDVRSEEMRALDQARRETEQVRRDRDDRLAARRKELEQRRRDVEARKAQKRADKFLQDLGGG